MSVETARAVDASAGDHLREDDGALLNKHLDEYGNTCREVARRLVRVWNDVGLDAADQSEELAEVTRSIMGVWQGALQRAEEGKVILGEQVDMALTEIARLKVQLSDEEGGVEKDGAKAEESSDEEEEVKGKTLKERYEGLLVELEKWRARRAERSSEFDEVLTEMSRVRARLGQPMPRSTTSEGQVRLLNAFFGVGTENWNTVAREGDGPVRSLVPAWTTDWTRALPRRLCAVLWRSRQIPFAAFPGQSVTIH